MRDQIGKEIMANAKKDWWPDKNRVAEVMQEGGGFWRACSGCQESAEGYVSPSLWPYCEVFQCQPGMGCGECGGIGVVWDNTDYDKMAREALALCDAEAGGK